MRLAGKKAGFVLVTVLWVVAILTVIALGFGRRALLERTAATYSLDHVKAMQMARGAVARGIVELRNKATYDFLSEVEGRTSYAQQWSRPRNLLAGESEGGEAGEDDVKYFEESGDENFENDICAYVIRDEESRINLSTAPDQLLDEVPGLSRSMIRKINVRRRGDAGKNQAAQPFQTIEELRYMDDVDDDEWFGTDEKPGLVDILTCFGNDGKVNVNTASEAVLNCIPKLRGAAEAITAYRAGADGELYTRDDLDFANIEDLSNKLSIHGAPLEAIRAYCKFSSEYFTITGTATRRNGKIRATCVATVYVSVSDGHASVRKWREEFLEP